MEIVASKELRKVTKPTFVEVGGKQIISSGRWNNDLMAEYVLDNGINRWITTGELAKTAYGQNIPRTKKSVRKCLSQLFNTLLARGSLMAVEYGQPRGRAHSVKIANLASEQDRQALHEQLERRRRLKEFSSAQYDRAVIILHATLAA